MVMVYGVLLLRPLNLKVDFTCACAAIGAAITAKAIAQRSGENALDFFTN